MSTMKLRIETDISTSTGVLSEGLGEQEKMIGSGRLWEAPKVPKVPEDDEKAWHVSGLHALGKENRG